MMIRFYSGTVMYTNFYEDKHVKRGYRKVVMSMSVNELQTRAVHISNQVKYSDGEGCCAWIVPIQVNPHCLINDLKSSEAD